MTLDIVQWLRDEERRLRERAGAVHGDSPQYHAQALNNQADHFAEAAREIERLRALVAERADGGDGGDGGDEDGHLAVRRISTS